MTCQRKQWRCAPTANACYNAHGYVIHCHLCGKSSHIAVMRWEGDDAEARARAWRHWNLDRMNEELKVRGK